MGLRLDSEGRERFRGKGGVADRENGMGGSQGEGQFKLRSEDLSRFSVAGEQIPAKECAMCVNRLGQDCAEL